MFTILLSTYNGEKYLEEQLQSIFNQTYWNKCTLFVRDDGSKDNTVSILKSYESEGKLTLTCGENIGFVKSFFWLIKNAPSSDYYGFADQDDIWIPTKIHHAVEKLRNCITTIPAMYYSDYSVINGEGEIIENHHVATKIKPTFFNAMTVNQSSGFTMCFNMAMAKELKKITPVYGQYHDYWVYLISLGFGELIYDNFNSAYYRRYGKNESGEVLKGIPLVKSAFSISEIQKIFRTFCITLPMFNDIFYDKLSNKNKTIIKLFVNKSFINQIRKIFYLKKYRKSNIKDLYCRLLCLLRII